MNSKFGTLLKTNNEIELNNIKEEKSLQIGRTKIGMYSVQKICLQKRFHVNKLRKLKEFICNENVLDHRKSNERIEFSINPRITFSSRPSSTDLFKYEEDSPTDSQLKKTKRDFLGND